ncbi:LCP family protein [Fusibacter sp. 3D3]|uniref:LCP family protein n=1 Tax=Fusibacter sp. 3D3 TaxID=1048380 RepID=UPI000852A2A4|nr:LCP family protein [Fusibacter sp. 3D3]GAU77056.1 cell envelope-associated transcriptionalattenuator LytR-CpsA-Psr [Fusibacter sp. 3D3]
MKKGIKIIILLLIMISALFVGFGAFYQDRINVLVFGVEGTRTDTMILLSIDTATNNVSAVSIPRDTYFPTEGHNKLGQKKLNARYGFKDVGGAEGLTTAIEELMGIQIDHYIKVDYEGVTAIVNLLGDVEVDVPIRMQYDDPYATPPLHIDFEPGLQKISGENALGYLRFRKSNDGKVREGDIQRIVRQQAFLKSAAKEALTFKLPFIASKALDYVETNLTTKDVLLYTSSLMGASMDDVHFYTLPMKSTGTGKDGLSYFYHDSSATFELMKRIYDGSLAEQEALERESQEAVN